MTHHSHDRLSIDFQGALSSRQKWLGATSLTNRGQQNLPDIEGADTKASRADAQVESPHPIEAFISGGF
jgi:hypothetical protein